MSLFYSQVKIADFGLARILTTSDIYNPQERKLPDMPKQVSFELFNNQVANFPSNGQRRKPQLDFNSPSSPMFGRMAFFCSK